MSESFRILILEDNPIDAELAKFELQEAGFIFTSKVVMTENDYVRELQEYSPGLILSDYDVPRYNGALALAAAKRICPDTPFILVTGAVTEDRAIEILTQGAKDYVLKARLQQRLAPAVGRALMEAAEHLARKQAEAELLEAHRTLEDKVKIRTAELETEMAARQRVEEALRQSEARERTRASELQTRLEEMDAVFTAQNDAVLLYDEGMKVRRSNPCFLAIYGFDPIGLHLKEIAERVSCHWMDGRPFKWEEQPTPRALQGEKVTGALFLVKRADGTEAAVETSSAPIWAGDRIAGSVTVWHDFTERKRSEMEIARLASFPMLNPAPIIELDFAGTILFCNPAAERLFPDLRQRGLEHPMLADWESIVRDFGEGGLTRSSRELNVSGRWYHQTVNLVEETQRIRIYGHDITLRKEAEKDLMEHAIQLEATNKELESFSYSVSHDLRAPLRAIDGYARMILKQQGDKFDENTKRQFEVIRKNTQMMGQLIDDLLAFSRLGTKAISMSLLNMTNLSKDVWEELKLTNPDGVINIKIDQLPQGVGDRSLIKQVLVNILSNAIKFTRFRDAPLIEVGGYVEEAENVYYIRDNGVGFDMQYHDNLYGVFQRIHNADEYEGTGIGLAIVQRIIHRHGGRVWAEGKVNVGACFYFTLPRDH